MLRLNKETDYAIRVILALAKCPQGEIFPSQVIRQEMDLPRALSIQIISHLAHKDLINTYPGRNGGIQLARPAREITLHQVICAVEGPLILSECLEEDHTCQFAPHCPVQVRWIDLQGVIERELKAVNFDVLVNEIPFASAKDVQ